MIRLSRRDLILAFLSLVAAPRPALPQAPGDRGIGGTGAAPDTPTIGDRGIGGTGVIGTIRRFGSIYVNGLRIAYPADVAVFIDGAPARPGDMRVGHVVQTVALGPDSGLLTRRIDISSEVIGPVEKLVPNGMIVLGQSVDWRGVARRGNVRPGAFVAVFGQRRPNGTIVASLIEPRSAGRTKIAGPVRADADGRLSIGSMALRGVPAGLVGSRVSVEGMREGGTYSVSSLRSLARPFGTEVRRVSIEGYVAPGGGRLGSGLAIAGVRNGTAGLAVIAGRVGASGGLVADTVRRDSRAIDPTLGAPVPSKPGIGSLPLGGGDTNLGGSSGLLPGGGGSLLPSTPNIGLPGGGGIGSGAPGIGLPGGVGLPGLRR